MPRIGKPGAQHALIARGDRRTAILRRQIGDEGEIRRGLAGGIAQGKIFLVDLHGKLAHLGRQLHEFRVDLADQRHRPFGQARYLVQQPVIRRHGKAELRGRSGNTLGDFRRRSCGLAIT